jgi:hypothetical protein
MTRHDCHETQEAPAATTHPSPGRRWTRRLEPALFASALVALTALPQGCVQTLPPPEAPSQELSREVIDEAFAVQSSEGEGVVVLDIVDGAARVEDLGTELDGAGAEEICEQTPCVARLELGQHRLVFHQDGRDDEVTFQVTPEPRAYRRVMSYDSGGHQDYFALAVSGLALGGLTLPIIDPLSDVGNNNSTAADVALVIGGVGAGAAIITGIVGVILAITDPQQVRDGAETTWQLTPPN